MQRHFRRAVALGFVTAALAVWLDGPSTAQETHVGEYSQADITHGMRVYGEACVACHGPDGDTVVGVNLRTGQFRQASSDGELRAIISGGIEGTAMPPGDYSSSELTGLVAYLRTMGDFDPSEATVGDAGRGESIYNGKGDCASCHQIGGTGSRVAPNLSDIGALRSAGSLAESLVNPTSAMLPVNRTVRITTGSGERITGRRLNEDTYTVQIIDENERLRSLVKDDLREYTVLVTSSMPSYDETLTEQERADVLAYLLTLKGVTE